MDANQVIIKTVLIALLAVLAIVVVVPGRGARGQALQRLTLVLVLVLGGIAVAFPHLTQIVADFLGVGRGVDLVFYAAIVLGIAYAVQTTVRMRRDARDLTILARKVALLEANVREHNDTLPDGSLTSEEAAQ